MVHVPLFVNQNPPHRVRAYSIHPLGDGRHFTTQVETLRHYFILTKNAIDHTNFRMHVTHPD